MGIVKTEDVLGGKPRLEGRRISVLQIKDLVDRGREPTHIAADFDLDLADVHTALSYYYDHSDEMREWREHQAELERTLREREISGPENIPDENRRR
ncbi:MAG TPA: DUF433 domain-containing protein [Halococcus sp.]|nr:DUF433 domain-containing protein [Halococcus sp.]